jgi:hypothetical protein
MYQPTSGNTGFFPNALAAIGAVQPPSHANGYATSFAPDGHNLNGFSSLSITGNGNGTGNTYPTDASAVGSDMTTPGSGTLANGEQRRIAWPSTKTFMMMPGPGSTTQTSGTEKKGPMVVSSDEDFAGLTVSAGGPVGPTVNTSSRNSSRSGTASGRGA